MKPVLHAKYLKAYADGQKLQFRNISTDEYSHGWVDYNHERQLWDFDSQHLEFRIKPDTFKINGFNIPKPVKNILKVGEGYWCLNPKDKKGYSLEEWQDHQEDFNALNNGCIFLHEDSCKLFFSAIKTSTGV